MEVIGVLKCDFLKFVKWEIFKTLSTHVEKCGDFAWSVLSYDPKKAWKVACFHKSPHTSISRHFFRAGRGDLWKVVGYWKCPSWKIRNICVIKYKKWSCNSFLLKLIRLGNLLILVINNCNIFVLRLASFHFIITKPEELKSQFPVFIDFAAMTINYVFFYQKNYRRYKNVPLSNLENQKF